MNVDMVNNRRADGDLAALLCALSFATGVAFGGHMEHGLGCAALGLQLADAMALSHEEREAIFYGALLKDVACTACSAGIAAFLPDEAEVSLADVILVDPSRMSDMMRWLSRYLRPDIHFPMRISKLLSFVMQCGPIVKETMRSHCEVAELFARQLGFPAYVQQALRFQWERWDGKGMAYGLKGDTTPRSAHILHFIQVLELTYRFGGPSAPNTIAREKRGTRFNPEVVDAFLALAQHADFWKTFEEQSSLEALLRKRPATVVDYAAEDYRARVCEALADLTDLKTRETWHHSHQVAAIANGIGLCLGLGTDELCTLRYTALVHDIGKVAIPVTTLTKREEQRSNNEREMYRLHTYYTQRILEQVADLKELALAASTHEEWMNGQGYHRQLHGEQIPLHGRILAVANIYASLYQRQKDQTEVLHQMHSLVDTQLDRRCYDALVQSLTGETLTRLPTTPQKTTPLTRRETEVLCLLAQGQNTPQIARTLSISKKTVEHHLTHIYAKFNVTCRTAAVVYAVQHGLV
jgi:HD-GYP domain-containing protein (c-di-GMP phosphodiesterase class II)